MVEQLSRQPLELDAIAILCDELRNPDTPLERLVQIRYIANQVTGNIQPIEPTQEGFGQFSNLQLANMLLSPDTPIEVKRKISEYATERARQEASGDTE